MLKKLATLVGLGVAAGVAAQTTAYTPYRDSSTNTIYNLLFGDDLALSKPVTREPSKGPGKLSSPNQQIGQGSRRWQRMRQRKPAFAFSPATPFENCPCRLNGKNCWA